MSNLERTDVIFNGGRGIISKPFMNLTYETNYYIPDAGKIDLLLKDLLGNALPLKDQIDLNGVTVHVANEGDQELDQASKIVNYAYNTRYNNGGYDFIDLATESKELKLDSKTLVLTQDIMGNKIVLGTFKVVLGDGDLDTFHLFGNVLGWPHEQGHIKKPVAEFSRFALHPLFEVKSINADAEHKSLLALYKRITLRMIWRYSIQLLDDKDIDYRYFVLAPEIAKFVRSSGINPVPVRGSMPLKTQYSTMIRRRFNGYWKPNAISNDQPKVYFAPREILPLTWKIGGQRFLFD